MLEQHEMVDAKLAMTKWESCINASSLRGNRKTELGARNQLI
jgi:hypothetical protein